MGARGLGHVAEAGARIVLSVLILTILVLGVTGTRSLADEPSGDTLRIASFNLHFIRPEGRLFERWLRRRDAVIAAIRELDADIVALQEVETFAGRAFNDGNLQLDWLREQLPDYAVAAVGDVRSYPSTQPVLYKWANSPSSIRAIISSRKRRTWCTRAPTTAATTPSRPGYASGWPAATRALLSSIRTSTIRAGSAG